MGLLIGFAFYFTVVNTDSFFDALVTSLHSTTNIFSILFGWQWVLLTAGAVTLLVQGFRKNDKACRQAALIVLASLAAVLISAQIVYSRSLYITAAEGGPAGPDFNCMVWDEMSIYASDTPLCTVMSIPSFNKFLIDRSYTADQSDTSASYYTMFLINEAVLLGGIALAARRLPKD